MTPRRSAVAPIVDRFMERVDEVVERCHEAIWNAVPAYSRSGDDLGDDVRDAVRNNVATLANVLQQSREIKREELEGIRRVGGRRAEQGIPLDDVLHAYGIRTRAHRSARA